MGTYVYKAKRGPKEIVRGEVEALSQDEAVNKLDNMGLVPITVTEKGAAPRQTRRLEPGQKKNETKRKSLKFKFSKIKPNEIDIFTRELATLIRASVPILRSLSLIAQQTENPAFKDLIFDLIKQVRDGKTFSETIEKYPRSFDKLYLNMIRSGEKGGVLSEVLSKLSEYREKEAEIKRKVQVAMAYPVLMILVGIGTVFVMLTYFLPKLIGLFEDMGQSLPLPTKILIGTSNFMTGNWYWILIAFFLVFSFFSRVQPGSKKKMMIDVIKLRVPFAKKLIRVSEIAKFTRTLEMLMKNGIPVYESLGFATDTVDNEALREKLVQMQGEIISKGTTLSESLRKAEIFPKFVVSMISVGEESGKLDESLNEIGNVYEKEFEQIIKIMTTLLEPLLILVVGGIIGFMVFAMLLPILNIGAMEM